MSATHDPRESPECHCDVCKAFRREKAAAHLADSELLAALSAAVDDQGDWPEWKRIELKRRLAAERFFEGESDADAAAFAAMADAIKHESDNIKLKAERSAFVKLTLERSNEVDRLRAENARLQWALEFEVDCHAATVKNGQTMRAEKERLREENARQAETITRLREALTGAASIETLLREARDENTHLRVETIWGLQRSIGSLAATVERLSRLRMSANNLVEFWDQQDESGKLTATESDELAHLESELREALKEGA